MEFLLWLDRGKCSVDRGGTVIDQSRHSWHFFTLILFFGGGVGGGGALNSTWVEFIPRLYQGRYPADRKDTAIGQSRHS